MKLFKYLALFAANTQAILPFLAAPAFNGAVGLVSAISGSIGAGVGVYSLFQRRAGGTNQERRFFLENY